MLFFQFILVALIYLLVFLNNIIELLKEIKPVFFQKQTTKGINQPCKQFLLQTGRHPALRIYLQQAFVMVVLPPYLTPPHPERLSFLDTKQRYITGGPNSLMQEIPAELSGTIHI